MKADSQHPLNPCLQRLRELAEKCHKLDELGNYEESEAVAKQFLNILNESLNSLPNSDDVIQLLEGVQSVLRSSCGQVLLNWLTLDLPRVIANTLDRWKNTWPLCESVISHMCESCSPREMFTAIVEAFSCSSLVETELSSLLLLSGLSIVIARVRRPAENLSAVLPVIFNAVKITGSRPNVEITHEITVGSFDRMLALATSLQEVCKKELDEEKRRKLQSILCLYALETLALASKNSKISALPDSCGRPSLVLELSEFITYCGFSYQGLFTGREMKVLNKVLDNDEQVAEFMPLINKGAILAVLWCYIHKETDRDAGNNIQDLMKYLKSHSSERICALTNMKYLFSDFEYPLQLQHHSLRFFMDMLEIDSDICGNANDNFDWPSVIPSLFTLMQTMQQTMIYTPFSELRKQTFVAFKKLLSVLSPNEEFDILKSLIMRSDNSSMVSLLLGIVKDEVAKALHEEDRHKSPFLSKDVLELVEFILRPRKGGPPDLPAQSDAVLAALNLYRFLLMKESSGKTNYTGALSKSSLQEVETEWLLPLRAFVSGLQSETNIDNDYLATSVKSGLNLIELVLHHCLQLIEELLNCCT